MKNSFVFIFVATASLFFNANAYAEAQEGMLNKDKPLPRLVSEACLLPMPNRGIETLTISSLDSIDINGTSCGRAELVLHGKGKLLYKQKNNTEFEMVLVDSYQPAVFNYCLDQLNRALGGRVNVEITGYMSPDVIVPAVIATFDPFAFAVQAQNKKKINYFYMTSCKMKR